MSKPLKTSFYNRKLGGIFVGRQEPKNKARERGMTYNKGQWPYPYHVTALLHAL